MSKYKKLVLKYANSLEDNFFEGLGQMGKIKLSPKSVVLIEENENSEQKIVSLPGITGSTANKTSPNDKSVILEIANFENEMVARSSFSINYRSDASKLYSGKLENSLSKIAFIRYSQILDQYNIKIKKVYSHNELTDKIISFDLDLKWVYNKISTKLKEEQKLFIQEKLQLLGKLENGIFYPNNLLNIIYNKEDFLQEIVRLLDFVTISDNPIKQNIINSDIKNKVLYSKISSLKNVLCDLGFDEVITRPFVKLDYIFDQTNAIKLVNPSSELVPYLSDNLTHRLLDIYISNLNTGNSNISIFEINKIFSNSYKSNNDHDNFEKLCLGLVFESTDPNHTSTIANKLFNFLNQNHCQTFEQLKSNEGEGYIYKSDSFNINLIQVSKKVLKLHNIPLTKKIWTIEALIDNLLENEIKKYNVYSDENNFSNITKVVNIEIDTNSSKNIIYWRNEFINNTSWKVDFECVDIYKDQTSKSENNQHIVTASIKLVFNGVDKNLTNNEVDEYITKILNKNYD